MAPGDLVTMEVLWSTKQEQVQSPSKILLPVNEYWRPWGKQNGNKYRYSPHQKSCNKWVKWAEKRKMEITLGPEYHVRRKRRQQGGSRGNAKEKINKWIQLSHKSESYEFTKITEINNYASVMIFRGMFDSVVLQDYWAWLYIQILKSCPFPPKVKINWWFSWELWKDYVPQSCMDGENSMHTAPAATQLHWPLMVANMTWESDQVQSLQHKPTAWWWY